MLMFMEGLLYFKHCETDFSYISTFNPHNNTTKLQMEKKWRMREINLPIAKW